MGYVFGCWTFFGVFLCVTGLFLGFKIWPHSHLPVTNIPEYPPWGVEVLSTMFKREFGHRKEIRLLRFPAYGALRQSESRNNCGLYVVNVVSSGVTLFDWWEHAANVMWKTRIKDKLRNIKHRI